MQYISNNNQYVKFNINQTNIFNTSCRNSINDQYATDFCDKDIFYNANKNFDTTNYE